MPNPNEHFDQTVLEMIEHSPTGAVPNTPAYQDSLNRLYAAHQVYASADHKGGHVTARSLTRLPAFHAANLDAFAAGQIPPETLEANAHIFDRYVQSLPSASRAKAESFRAIVAGRPAHHRKHGGAAIHDPVHTLFLVPGTGPHPGLPGNYLHGTVLQLNLTSTSPWAVHVHDSDDGTATCEVPDLTAAIAKLHELLDSAPFTMNEITALGFQLK